MLFQNEWQMFGLQVLRHPTLRTFRSGARLHILEFVELSVRYGPRGIVDFYDDEIACDLGMGLEQWLDLRDKMLVCGVIRAIALPDDRRRYEVAFWLLPDQTDKEGKKPDARSLSPWSVEPELPLVMVSDSYKPPTKPRGKSGAERIALWRARQAAKKASEPFDEVASLADYRAKKAAESAPDRPDGEAEPGPESPAPEAPSETDVTGNCPPIVTEIVTDSVTKNGNGNGAERSEKKERIDEPDNNTSQTGTDPVTVTERCNETEVVVAASPCNEIGDAISFMSVTGVTLPSREVVLISLERAEMLAKMVFAADGNMARIYQQAEWLPYRHHKPDKTWAGLWIDSIERKYAVPETWAKEQAERDRLAKEAETRRLAKVQAHERVADRKRLHEEENARLAEIEEILDNEEREEIDKQVRAGLTLALRQRLEKAERDGESPGELVVTAMKDLRRKALLQLNI